MIGQLNETRLAPQDERRKLFATDAPSPGQGYALGLSLAPLIAELHQGGIDFVTTADGQGFDISFTSCDSDR